jgi:hypothetical protein
MKYLEVGVVNNVQLELFVQTILTNNTHQTRHLSSFCLDVRKANDDIVQKLQTMINLKKLLHDYSIKRMGDKIYLQLKQE